MKHELPMELQPIKEAARRALEPVKPAGSETRAAKNFQFITKRTKAGRALPPYYLVYFLLVDLLEFQNLGQFEKVSWSVPIDLHGQAFLIEHRKFGIGVFAKNPKTEEDSAKEIVSKIQNAVKVARPFFDWLADQAVRHSKVNVINNSPALFQRYEYFLDVYQKKNKEIIDRKDEVIVEEGESAGGKWRSMSFPLIRLTQEAGWLALAAVEAFFSWTEQVFIHLAMLSGKIATAEEVASLAESNWSIKFKAALDLTDSEAKQFHDKLMAIRKELRNYVAHGAFGKQGEAFMFHSGVGAVPVLLPHRIGSRKFRLGEGISFRADVTLEVIKSFISFLWSSHRAPAELYIQQSALPIILTLVEDGTYSRAMDSTESMQSFIEYISHQFDQAANMDW